MNKMQWRMQKSKYGYLKFVVFTKKRLSFTRKKYFITISIINYELAFISDACVLKEYNCERIHDRHIIELDIHLVNVLGNIFCGSAHTRTVAKSARHLVMQMQI